MDLIPYLHMVWSAFVQLDLHYTSLVYCGMGYHWRCGIDGAAHSVQLVVGPHSREHPKRDDEVQRQAHKTHQRGTPGHLCHQVLCMEKIHRLP